MANNLLLFSNRVAIVTGAGGGLGREYALLLASRGASVVVNDLGGSRDGQGSDKRAADIVVAEIRNQGGKAVANYDSVENGESIVKTAIDNFGRIDIVVNNAGILRDRSFKKLSDQDWYSVIKVHLDGARKVTQAAWPYLLEQSYGRIIMTSSNAGLFGNFGQTAYSAAKNALIGFAKTLAIEGAKYNIHCNAIVPVAGSRLTEDVLPADLFGQFKPQYVAPTLAWLCHESCPESGSVIETAGGWVGKYAYLRTRGKVFNPPETMSPEAIRDNWSEITDTSIGSYPESITEQISELVSSIRGESTSTVRMNKAPENGNLFQYDADKLILYALGVGVNVNEPYHLRYLYESDPDFTAFPTFGVIPGLHGLMMTDLLSQAAQKYGFTIDPTRLLHGEQFLEIKNQIQVEAKLRSEARIVDVLDKGSGALIIADVDSYDSEGKHIFYNQFSLFIVGAGKFGGQRSSENQKIKSVVSPPSRPADAIVTEKTSIDQAALYRLSGDKNPLHIDPNFSAVAGFNKPILHGLCSLGFATRHVLHTYANGDPSLFKAVKARFSGTIIPGETIKTEMWKEGNRIHLRCSNVETGKSILEGAYIDLDTAKINPSHQIEQNNADIPHEAFKDDDELYLVSDPIFEEMGRRIEMAPDVASKINAIYEFIIYKDEKEVKRWVLDLKSAEKGLFAEGSKIVEPDCIIQISDQDMAALAMGDLDPVKGFMEGTIRIVGDPSVTQKLNYIFKLDSSVLHIEKTAAADREKFGSALNSTEKNNASNSQMACRIDSVFENWAAKRLNDLKSMIPTIKTVYQWNITKDGKPASVWTCDFKNGDGAIHRGLPKTGKADCILTIDDDFVCKIFEGKEDAMRAFMSGKLKISGNILAAQKLQQLWAEEAPNVAATLSQEEKKSETKPESSSSDSNVDPDIEEIPVTGYKCDLIFNIFKNRCHEEPDFMKRLRVVFQFNVLRKGKPACVWTADNKTKQFVQVYRDLPKNIKPDCIVTMEDEELLKVMVGKVNPQRLFMQGKIRVKGNIMLLQKLNSLWLEYQKLGKTPELPIAMDILLLEPLKIGLKSESIFIDLVQRIVRLPELLKDAKGFHNFNITKENKVVSNWVIDLTGEIPKIKRGSATDAVSTWTLDDYDIARLVLMKLKLADALAQNKVTIEGNKEKALKLEKMFTIPTSLKPKI